MSDFYWYGSADRSYRGDDSYLGNSCWHRGAYLLDSMKKTGLQFRSGPLDANGFTEMWNDPEHYTCHFTILKNGTVLQHYPTQAVTRSRQYGTGWASSYCLEANCVVVVFEGPFNITRYLCHHDDEPHDEGWFYCNYYDSDLMTDCQAADVDGATCYYEGVTNFPSGVPSTQAQIDAAIDLARWLFYAAYHLGTPLENQNVWGASYWGEPLFDEEPAPAPPVDIPWQLPVIGGSQTAWWNSYDAARWTGCSGYHRALDIAGLSAGTVVRPAAGNHQGRGSRVLSMGYAAADMGWWVRLAHTDESDNELHGLPRIDTVYCHLQSDPRAWLTVGQWITMRYTIGYLGGTPNYPPHLHLGVYVFPDNVTYASSSQNTTPYAPCAYRADPLHYLQ